MNAITPTIAAAPAATLTSRAMLARLKISKWSATRIDKKITRDVAQQHNASTDAGRYNKRLVGKEALAAINTIADLARGEHAARTLPWTDEGARILSARGFADYSTTLRNLKSDFDSAVADFAASYPAYIETARQELNGMFRESDYPPASEIAARFSFRFEISCVPDAGDFRVALDSGQVDEIRASMEANAREAFAAATRDVWNRVAETVGHMADRLKAYKPGGEGKKAEGVFRDSLVQNVRDLAGLLPSLNIADDPALAAIASEIAASLCADDAKELRDNDAARASVAAAAESILAKVSDFLA